MGSLKLATDYKGCRIELDADPAYKVGLKINGIQRQTCRRTQDSGHHSGSPAWTARLTSTVQTDYEWHEFIEAVVSYSEELIDASIYANNTKIIAKTCPRIRQ